MVAAASTNKAAQALKSLVRRKGRPLVLTNVYDRPSAQIVAELPQTEALATASAAIANAAGLADEGLDFKTNFAAVQGIAAVAKQHGKPLTVDMQDGYSNGKRMRTNVGNLVRLGVAGVNIEDAARTTSMRYPAAQAADRIHHVLSAAARLGVPDFVVNARCDELLLGGNMDMTVRRGLLYLEAGATTVFVIGGAKRGGLSRGEVEELVKAFDGRLNVMLDRSADGLSIKELAEMGVARISVGPTLQAVAMAALKKEAATILDTDLASQES